MALFECQCPKFFRSRCVQCWRPKGTKCHDTIGLIDISPKFGFVSPADAASEAAYSDAVGSVLPIRPLREIVMHYLVIESYEIFDIVDSIDASAFIYPAIILDKWTRGDDDSNRSTWYFLRFIGFTYGEDLLVQQDSIAPRSSCSSAANRRSVRKSNYYQNDPRWRAFDYLPFALIKPVVTETDLLDALAAFLCKMHRLRVQAELARVKNGKTVCLM
jgi:hypothetical protein